jgi:hypothetical protein
LLELDDVGADEPVAADEALVDRRRRATDGRRVGLGVNFTLFSLAEPQSVRKIAMLSRAAGISGLMSKPPGGFVQPA